MKFIVTRASIRRGDPLVGGAKRERLATVGPDQGDDKDFWTIGISSIDDLVALKKREGDDLVLTDTRCKGVPLGIEIYDDYRE